MIPHKKNAFMCTNHIFVRDAAMTLVRKFQIQSKSICSHRSFNLGPRLARLNLWRNISEHDIWYFPDYQKSKLGVCSWACPSKWRELNARKVRWPSHKCVDPSACVPQSDGIESHMRHPKVIGNNFPCSDLIKHRNLKLESFAALWISPSASQLAPSFFYFSALVQNEKWVLWENLWCHSKK